MIHQHLVKIVMSTAPRMPRKRPMKRAHARTMARRLDAEWKAIIERTVRKLVELKFGKMQGAIARSASQHQFGTDTPP